MFKDFREFAMKGNVVDLAVGIIIGAAFGKIVSSFVSDILMPPIGLILGGVDFSNLFLVLKGKEGVAINSLAQAKEIGATTLNYGLFVNTVIDFLIVAFAVFLLVKQLNRMKKAPPPPESTSRECPHCVTAIPKKASRCPACTSEVTPVT